MRIKCLVHIFSGSLGSAVDKRTRNNCMRVKCKIRIFSGSLGSKEIVVTTSKTCRIIKTNGCYDKFPLFIQTVLAVSHIRRSTSLRTQTYFRLLLVPPA